MSSVHNGLRGRALRRHELMNRMLEVIERLIADGERFTDITVERLVSEAEVSRSTFYVYFEDKGDLLRGWFSAINAEIADAAQTWWDLDGDATRDDLRRAQRLIFEAYAPRVALLAATNDAASYDPAVREALDVEIRK